ncbi:MAG TPA: glucose 1-dehydrogenase [Dehalococcoidia bacterium]|nr:glucose 1-dehydrogenase [Dehalococcoidia bacterium]
MKDMFSLEGKVAVVTGGNGGIGKGIADGLAAKACTVVVAGRDEQKTAWAVEDIKSRFGAESTGLMMDVASPESIRQGIRKVVGDFGRIDVLVNNAGVNIRKMPQDYALDEWDKILNTNLRGAFVCCQAVYPTMKRQGQGKIINTGSMTSLYGLGKAAPYACSKMGILSLTYSLALAWARDGIRVNCILPGWIDTPLTAQARKDFPGLTDFVEERTPLGRWGMPADFMGIAAFLASEASDFITGEYFRVDGGFAQHTNTVSFS